MKIKIENQDYILDLDKARQCGALKIDLQTHFNNLRSGDVFKNDYVSLILVQTRFGDENSFTFLGCSDALLPWLDGFKGSKNAAIEFIKNFNKKNPTMELKYFKNINKNIQDLIRKEEIKS
jgi:hypothetical protein